MTDRAAVFETMRPRLFGIAYRMLESVADAEDAVQESWLRLERASDVESVEGFLVTTLTRICIDETRTARARREEYVGPWLPEPVPIEPGRAGPDALVESTEFLSIALLRVLERLSAAERAVFLLHDVFGYTFEEISAIVERRTDNCRQIARRARERVRRERPVPGADPHEHGRLLAAFLAATDDGDLPRLESLLAEDVVLTSDSGGLVPSARRPVAGADAVSRFMVGVAGKAPTGTTVSPISVNGLPAALVLVDGRPEVAVSLDVTDGRIAEVFMIRNPDKLRGLVPRSAQEDQPRP